MTARRHARKSAFIPSLPLRPPRAAAAPAFAWFDLAWKTSEMLLASAQVIAHRTARMQAAGPLPSARDVAEFTLMGREKLEAGVDCALAAARHDVSGTLTSAALVWQRLLGLSTTAAGLAFSRNPLHAVEQHARLMRGMVAVAEEQTRLAVSTAALAADVLTPVHRRTRANARRLGKLRPR